MITLIDGKPGGGKSYYMVRHIVLKAKDYCKVYTNINEFKYDSFTNVYKFKDSVFSGLMDKAKLIFDREDTNDTDILEMLVEESFIDKGINGKYVPVLICIDEVHNLLGRSSQLWTWILTYHRHLFIDFMFATQDSALINTTYNKLFQKIYRALPNDRNIFAIFRKAKSNRYQEHLKLPIYDGKGGTFIQNLYIKKEDKYYELYGAGDEVRTKSIFSRFIWMAVILIAIVVIAFFSFIKFLFSAEDDVDIKKEYENSSTQIIKNHKDVSTSSDLFYLKFNCIQDTCKNKKHNIEFKIDDAKRLLSETDSEFLRSKEISKNHAYLFLLVNKNFLDMLGAKHEKSNKGIFNFNK